MCFINRQNGSTLLVIRKMRVRYGCTLTWVAEMKVVEDAKCWWGCGAAGAPHTAGGREREWAFRKGPWCVHWRWAYTHPTPRQLHSQENSQQKCVQWSLKDVCSSSTTFFFFKLKEVFIYLFLAALGLHCFMSSLWLCCVDFSLLWLLLLQSMGLVASNHMGSSWTRNHTLVPCIGRWILNRWTTREAPGSTTVNHPKLGTRHMCVDCWTCPWIVVQPLGSLTAQQWESVIFTDRQNTYDLQICYWVKEQRFGRRHSVWFHFGKP